MNVSRRGFLKGAAIATATIMVEMRMMSPIATAKSSSNYVFAVATENYGYSIDMDAPWSPVIYRVNSQGAPLSIVDSEEFNARLSPRRDTGNYVPIDDLDDDQYSTEEDEVEAIVAMSQAFIGFNGNKEWRYLGNPVRLAVQAENGWFV